MQITRRVNSSVTAASKSSKKVYYGKIERFGYDLTCIGLSEQEVKDSLIDAYVAAYIDENGIDPRDEDSDYYDTFLDELYIDQREFGKVYYD